MCAHVLANDVKQGQTAEEDSRTTWNKVNFMRHGPAGLSRSREALFKVGANQTGDKLTISGSIFLSTIG